MRAETGSKSKNRPKKKQGIRRRDRPGHIDPQLAANLHRRSGKREVDDQAFVSKPSSNDPLGEELGESVVRRATSGEGDELEELDSVVPEESGGPFVTTSASEEFADGYDASNRRGAKREPFPKT
jgi:hypothetical protein